MFIECFGDTTYPKEEWLLMFDAEAQVVRAIRALGESILDMSPEKGLEEVVAFLVQNQGTLLWNSSVVPSMDWLRAFVDRHSSQLKEALAVLAGEPALLGSVKHGPLALRVEVFMDCTRKSEPFSELIRMRTPRPHAPA